MQIPQVGHTKVQNKYINSNWEEDAKNNNNQENPTQDTHIPSNSTEERVPQVKSKCRSHSHPIHPRTGGEHQEHSLEIWYPGTFQE